MDRTSRNGVFICLALLVGLMFLTAPPPKPPTAATPPATASTAVTPNAPGTTPAVTNPAVVSAPIPVAPVPETLTVLENDALKVTLTSHGAAIKEVELKEQEADGGGHVVLNQAAHSNVLQLAGWPGADTVDFQSKGAVYYANLPNGLHWERRYSFDESKENDSGLGGFLRRASRWIAVHLGKTAPKQLVYTLNVSDTLTNPSTADVALPEYSLSLGRAEPLLIHKHFQLIANQYLGSGWLTQKFHLTTINDFNPSSIPLIGVKTRDGKDAFTSSKIQATGTTTAGSNTISGMSTTTGMVGGMEAIGGDIPVGAVVAKIVSSSEITLSVPATITNSAARIDIGTSVDDAPVKWLGVENQFFAVLLTPADDHPIQHAVFQCYNQRNANGYVLSTSDPQARDPDGYLLPGFEPNIEAAAVFPAFNVPAGKSVSLTYGLYAGPKDYNRLDALGDNQGALMNYDGILPFSLLIVPMLAILHFWYLIFSNYGYAIILLTLMIKAITWPLQSFANRSGKRMQALAPKLKELQAKYKDQPEKLQSETFAMYKDYGVNPFGGCVPAFIQMPVFFSLYFMLQNAVELRGQSFFWVKDLTQPDTVFSCMLPFSIPLFGPHLTLNLLPIMVTVLTMIMMRMTPQMGDPAQAKIAQWMPMVFLFIFYNFAAALSLYYVINNCVSIIQIYRNLKKPLPVLERKPRKKSG